MLLIPEVDCDECVPDYARPHLSAAAYFSFAIFLSTFAAAAGVASRKLLPLLSGDGAFALTSGPSRSPTSATGFSKEALDVTATGASVHTQLPLHEFEFKQRNKRGIWKGMIAPKITNRRLVSLVFCTSLGLSAVLVELLLCEISGFLDSRARRKALATVLPALTFLLIVVAPALEIQSLLAALGLRFTSAAGTNNKHKVRFAWVFQAVGLLAWLAAFWFVGEAVLGLFLRAGITAGMDKSAFQRRTTFGEGCLERIGVIGISLMASLGGFAAVSATWQTLILERQIVTEGEIIRKQAGLDATVEMLMGKRARLRALERKMSSETSTASSGRGVWGSVLATLRGGATDSKERATLELEISGLESMRLSLQDTLYVMHTRKTEQERAHTFAGSMANLASLVIALYCAFRLASVGFSVSRRLLTSAMGGLIYARHGKQLQVQDAPHDPVTILLTVIANHWDPSLDRDAWTRQISFLLSGMMLIAALNSALQTFLLLARAFPGLAASAATFRDATTLALLVSQVVGAYVVSGALMLRSNVPTEVGSAISEALGGTPLPPSRVDAWFEVWFLGAAAVTALGIWAGRRMRIEEEEELLGADPEKGNVKTS
jgi:Abscisic acid G-protein coupled receptor/The Golgi pH Regulator (GPHR) Family N-terminal